MKKTILCLLFLCSIVTYSQTEIVSNGQLYKYLKKEISKKKLKNVRFSNGDNVYIYFYTNKEKLPYKFQFSTYLNSDLKILIQNSINTFFLNNLSQINFNSKKKYSIPILSKKKEKTILNSNLKLIEETAPITNSCSDLNYYEDLNTCFINEVSKTIKDQLSETDKTYLRENNILLEVKFSITKEGLNFDKSSKIPNKLKGKISYILKKITPLKELPTINNQFNTRKIKLNLNFDKVIASDNIKQNSAAFLNPNSDNDLSQFFKSKLSSEDLAKANLNRINNRITISFVLDEKGEIFNLKTSSRSNNFDEKIKAIFKMYPFDKLEFLSKKKFSSFILDILAFKEGETIIKASSKVGFERVPIFPGCESSTSIKEVKQCFSRSVQKHFAKTFNADLPNRLGLSSGRKRVIISYIIDKSGRIANISVKAPHIEIEKEVFRVMEKLPTVLPGEQNGKKVGVKYTIPFTLIIQ